MFLLPRAKADYRSLVGYTVPKDPTRSELILPYMEFNHPSALDTDKVELGKRVVATLIAGNGVTINSAMASRTLNLLTISSKRGIIAICDTSTEDRVFNQTLIFFSKIDHVDSYVLASKKSRIGGPGSKFPGCLGILDFQIDLNTGQAKLLQLQSAVKHRDSAVQKLLENPEKTNLRNYYAHWKFDLLHLAIDSFKRTGVSTILIKSPESPDLEITDKPIKPELVLEADRAINLRNDLLATPNPDQEETLWYQLSLSS